MVEKIMFHQSLQLPLIYVCLTRINAKIHKVSKCIARCALHLIKTLGVKDCSFLNAVTRLLMKFVSELVFSYTNISFPAPG